MKIKRIVTMSMMTFVMAFSMLALPSAAYADDPSNPPDSPNDYCDIAGNTGCDPNDPDGSTNAKGPLIWVTVEAQNWEQNVAAVDPGYPAVWKGTVSIKTYYYMWTKSNNQLWITPFQYRICYHIIQNTPDFQGIKGNPIWSSDAGDINPTGDEAPFVPGNGPTQCSDYHSVRVSKRFWMHMIDSPRWSADGSVDFKDEPDSPFQWRNNSDHPTVQYFHPDNDQVIGPDQIHNDWPENPA